MVFSILSFKKSKKKLKNILLNFVLMGIVLAIVMAVYFNNSFEKYYINKVANEQLRTIEDFYQCELKMLNAATQVMNNEYVLSCLVLEEYDVLTVGKAMSFIKSIKNIENISSIQIINKSKNKIWKDTSLIAAPLNEYINGNQELKDVLEKYEATKSSHFINTNHRDLTFVFDEHNDYLIVININAFAAIADISVDDESTEKMWVCFNDSYFMGSKLMYVQEPPPDIVKMAKSNEKSNRLLSHDGSYYVICKNDGDIFCITSTTILDVYKEACITAAAIWILLVFAISFTTFLYNVFMRKIALYEKEVFKYKRMKQDDGMNLLLRNVIHNMPLSDVDKEELKKILFRDETPCYSILIKINDYVTFSNKYSSKDVGAYEYGIFNITEELLSKCGYCKLVILDKGRICGVVSTAKENEMKSALERAVAETKKHLEISVSVAISKQIYNISELIDCYIDGFCEYGYVLNSGEIKNDCEILQLEAKYPIEMEKALIGAMSVKDNAGIKTILNKFVSYAIKQNPLVAEKWMIILTMNILKEPEYSKGNSAYQFLKEITGCESIMAAEEMLSKVFEIHEYEMDNLNEQENQFKGVVESIIEQNYSDPLFGLAGLAEKMGYSQDYLGKKIKRSFEMSFTQLLLNVRMREADTLLKETTEKASDIAVKCGFNSSTYFCTLWKKNTGLTPLEYRQGSVNKN